MLEMALACPDLPHGLAPLDVTTTIGRLDKFITYTSRHGIDCCFGLELRAAYYYEYVNTHSTQVNEQPMRKFFLRTAIEPIMYSYRAYVDVTQLEHKVVNEFVSSYSGILVRVREIEARSGKNAEGRYVVFPPHAHSARYLERIKTNSARLSCPIQRSAYAFAEVILSHPYSDGNARLGRCLSLMSLSHHMMCDPLSVPLGPVLMANNDRYVKALQDLSREHDWLKFFSEFRWFLDEALDLSSVLLRQAHDRSPTFNALVDRKPEGDPAVMSEMK